MDPTQSRVPETGFDSQKPNSKTNLSGKITKHAHNVIQTPILGQEPTEGVSYIRKFINTIKNYIGTLVQTSTVKEKTELLRACIWNYKSISGTNEDIKEVVPIVENFLKQALLKYPPIKDHSDFLYLQDFVKENSSSSEQSTASNESVILTSNYGPIRLKDQQETEEPIPIKKVWLTQEELKKRNNSEDYSDLAIASLKALHESEANVDPTDADPEDVVFPIKDGEGKPPKQEFPRWKHI